MSHPIPVLLYEIIQDLRARNPERTPLVGVAGAQGSGKSYQCRLLAMANQPRFAHFSLDDVYYTRAEREAVARGISAVERERFPAFSESARLETVLATRGPPGTHDLALAHGLIARLRHGLPTKLPRFDKAQDDRARHGADDDGDVRGGHGGDSPARRARDPPHNRGFAV